MPLRTDADKQKRTPQGDVRSMPIKNNLRQVDSGKNHPS